MGLFASSSVNNGLYMANWETVTTGKLSPMFEHDFRGREFKRDSDCGTIPVYSSSWRLSRPEVFKTGLSNDLIAGSHKHQKKLTMMHGEPFNFEVHAVCLQNFVIFWSTSCRCSSNFACFRKNILQMSLQGFFGTPRQIVGKEQLGGKTPWYTKKNFKNFFSLRRPETHFRHAQGHLWARALTGCTNIFQSTISTVYEVVHKKIVNTKLGKQTIWLSEVIKEFYHYLWEEQARRHTKTESKVAFHY